MAEVPEAALVESDRAGWVLVVVGMLIALTAPFLRREVSGRKPQQRRKAI
jgi:hypothetical protein